MRSVHTLLHASSIANWTSSVDCEVDFFTDVLKQLPIKIQSNSINSECALLCSGVKIKSSVIYNKDTGSYEGFIGFGKGEILLLPRLLYLCCYVTIGNTQLDVLCNAMDAVNLHCLLCKALDLSSITWMFTPLP